MWFVRIIWICSMTFLFQGIYTEAFELDNFEFNHQFLEDIITEYNQCRFYLFWTENSEKNIHNRNKIVNTLTNQCGSLVLSKYDATGKISLPSRSGKAYSYNCIVSFLIMFDNINPIVIEHLITPGINPPTLPNSDKFIFLTNKNYLLEITDLQIMNKIKFKLIIPMDQNELNIYQICPYCPNGPLLLSTDTNRFTDFQTNYYGSTLKLSTTTKVPQLLELQTKIGKDNETSYEPKRGVYAKVLIHLANKLNFSYEIFPSSGGGSTGHVLPNGSWVGIVGDVFSERVDFGLMAATTEQRFPFAEFCAPINFAFLGFATGPPDKIFSAKAIFWPFKKFVWISTILVICFTVGLFKILLYFQQPLDFTITDIVQPWNLRKCIFYFTGCILEQCGSVNLNSHSLRVYITFWLLFSMIISTVYRSKMVVLMTFPEYERVPSSMNELADSGYAIDFHYFGNVGYNFMKSSKSPSFQSIYERMGREPDPIACLHNIVKGKRACIIFSGTFLELKFRNLSDNYGNSPATFTLHRGIMFPAGVIHRYKAPLYKNFKSIIDISMEMGLIEHWQKSDFLEILLNKNRWEKREKLTTWDYIEKWKGDNEFADLLQLKKLKGAFGVYGVGLVLSCMWFGLELLYSKGKHFKEKNGIILW